MIAFLAQMPDPNSAQSIGWLALAIAAVAATVNQVLKLTDRFKESPPVHLTYATKDEHSELKEKVGDLDVKVTENCKALDVKVDENYKALENKRSASIANLHGKLDEQTKELNLRIDAVPQRTISLLLETQRLHKGP